LRHVRPAAAAETPSGFGGGDEVADLTDSQSHKKFLFEFYKLLAARKRSRSIALRV
jgi:hypothetical protein